MQVHVLYFASFREAAGRDEERLELAERACVGDLWSLLARRTPLFARFSSPPPAAVNREHVPADTRLKDGDEVAFLPPVAGG